MADFPSYGSPHSADPQSTTTQQVKEQAAAVGQSAVAAGGDVVASVKDQSKEVAAETARKARDLYGQVRSEVSDQAGVQQRRAVDGLYALGKEVAKMADQGGQSGPATQAARQTANRINQAAQWLEHREPGHVLDEVKDFARRRPGVFFVGAAVLGVLAGRLTRNLTPASSTDGDDTAGTRLTADTVPTDMASRPVPATTSGQSPVAGVVPAPAQPVDVHAGEPVWDPSSDSYSDDRVRP